MTPAKLLRSGGKYGRHCGKPALVEASRCHFCFNAPCLHCISGADVTTDKKPIGWVQHPSNLLREPAE